MGLLAIDRPPIPLSHKSQRAESVCSTSSKRGDRLTRAMGTRTEEERERYLEHSREKRRSKERAKAVAKTKANNKRTRVETIMREDSPAKVSKSLPDITQSIPIQHLIISIPTYQAPKEPLPEPRSTTYAGITLNNQQRVANNTSAFESVASTAARANITNIYTKTKELATTSTAYKTTTNNRKQTRPFLWSTHFFTVISDKADITAGEIDQVLLGCKKLRLSTIRQWEDIVIVETPDDRLAEIARKFLNEEGYKTTPVKEMDTHAVFTVPTIYHNMEPQSLINRLTIRNDLPQDSIKYISKAEEKVMGKDGPGTRLRYWVDVDREIIPALKRLDCCLKATCREIRLTPVVEYQRRA